MKKTKLSAKQAAVLAFCRAYFKENDQLPTYSRVAAEFDVWTNAAVEYFKTLEKKGYLERNEAGRFRFARPRRSIPTVPFP